MTRADLEAIRNPSLAFVAIAIIAAVAIYYTEQFVVTARKQLAQQEVLLREARTRLQKSGDEKDVIVKYLGAFQQLQ